MPIMSGLSSVMSALGSNNNWEKALTGGIFGAGEIGNLLEQKKRADYQNFVMGLLKDPAKLSRMAASTERPLDNALIQSVGNATQGQLAERGLSQSPGIFAATESQALAPYAQQNYQTAMQAILSSLQLPQSTFGAPSNNSGALQLFLKQFQKPTSDSTSASVIPPDFSGFTYDGPTGAAS